MAQGLREAKARALVGPALQLDSFLDSMLRSRITRRVLAEQHLAVSGGGGGIVRGALAVADAAEFAGQRAAMLCAEVGSALLAARAPPIVFCPFPAPARLVCRAGWAWAARKAVLNFLPSRATGYSPPA